MKKSRLTLGENSLRQCKKILLIMKLIAALILIGSLHVSAGVRGQNKINLKLEQTEITKVLKAIEKQGVYRFLYNSDIKGLKQKVSVDAIDADIYDLMPKLLSGKDLAFKMMGSNLVVIFSLKATPPDMRITGRVTSETGDAIASASIVIKGTKSGTVTDAAGGFSLLVPENATLIISAVGYETVEINVAGRTSVNVSLKLSSKKLDEVVVIGYGTASKRDLTGSIVKISGKDVADRPNTNPVASLQSKVAGLSIVNNATPGQEPDIRIRGTISIGSVHPLYVVDGIFSNNIDYINPNDIESIEVLKDPSSLAIFGVRGAAGVIAVTTKKAKAGQVIVNFNSSLGSKTLVDEIEVANADQFKTLYNTQRANSGQTPFDFSKWTGNTDWVKALTRTALINANNLSVSVASDKNRFYMGVGYTTDEGLVKHVVLKKFSLTINDEVKLTKSIKLGFNITELRQELPIDGNGYLSDARRIAPVVPSGTTSVKVLNPYGPDSINQNLYYGLPTIQNTLANPVLQLENNWDKQSNIQYRTVGSVFAEINFLRDFTFRSTFYADLANSKYSNYTPLYYKYDPQSSSTTLVNIRTGVSNSNTDEKQFQSDNILTYKKKIGNHNITALGGITTYYKKYENLGASVQQSLAGQPIPNDKRFWYINNGFGDPTTLKSSSEQWEEATLSYLFRALYNYNSKYYLNLSFRRDGASQFYRYGNEYKNFYAVGAAWEVTRENFMDKQHIFDFLKIKGSYGVLGNSNTLGYHYPLYPQVVAGNSSVFGNNYPYNIVSGYSPAYLISPGLTWESVNSAEIGFEANFLSNKLHVEGLYYNKRTKDVLTVIPGISGTRDYLGNLGDIQNDGIEVSANWSQNINKDLAFTASANVTTIKNKVIKLSTTGYAIGPDEQVPSTTTAGYPIGYFYGYQVAGIYQTTADIRKSPPLIGYTYGPGDFKFKDTNNDDKIDGADRTQIGNPTPKLTYGASVGFTYKGFDLGIDVGGVWGNQIYRVWGTTENPYSQYNYPVGRINSWSGPGTSNWEPKLSNDNGIIKLPSTYGIDNGSYFRIRNLQLGYNLPVASLNKIHIKSLRLFVNVQNLKTFKNNLGFSPEFGGSATQFGVDYGDASSALPRIIGGGINVTF